MRSVQESGSVAGGVEEELVEDEAAARQVESDFKEVVGSRLSDNPSLYSKYKSGGWSLLNKFNYTG